MDTCSFLELMFPCSSDCFAKYNDFKTQEPIASILLMLLLFIALAEDLKIKYPHYYKRLDMRNL